MGWLNFLSRKSSTIYNQSDDLKAQAYDETVAANPPIRGTFPVAGNGPSILEKFQKSHPHLRDIQFNDSAPPPVVPRILDRPSTAPNHRSPEGSARPKSQSGGSVRPLREPPKKRHGPYRLPSKIPGERGDDIQNSKSIYDVPSLKLIRDRNSSVFSGDSSSTRRFVDLLDAQSFIKPSDFYGRVKATGTRDYDEDVADRNIVENGSNSGSMHGGEFHADDFGSNVRNDESKVNRPRSSRKRHSMGAGLRTKSPASNPHSAFRMVVSSQVPEDMDDSEASMSQKASRRRSLHSYVPPSSADRPRSASAGRKAKRTDSHHFPDSLRERARLASQEDFERDMSINLSLERKLARSSRTAKEILTSGLGSDSDLSDYTYSPPQSTRVDQYHHSPRNTPKRRSLRISQDNKHVEPVIFSKPSSVGGSLPSSKSRSSTKRYRNNVPDSDGSYHEVPSLHPMELSKSKSAHSRVNSRDEPSHRSRKQSQGSVSKKSTKRSEIVDTVPELSSSVRRCSLTSETAGSTMSSNPFRPQSGHTTNTSVDLAPHVPLAKAMESDGMSSPPRDNRVAPKSTRGTDTPEPLYNDVDPEMLAESLENSGRRGPAMEFVIDEDSSSIDSFDAPQRPTGEFEKDLLFQGYGFEGSQLPGLFAAAPEKAGRPTSSHRTRAMSAFNGPVHMASFSSVHDVLGPSVLDSQYPTRSLRHLSHSRSSRLRVPDFGYTDSDDEGSEIDYESEEELNFDIPLTRPSGSRYQYQGERRRYEPEAAKFRDDDTESLEISTVARLRREAKAKQRASYSSLRKAKGKGKAPETLTPRIGLDDPSSYADAEL
ncbi:hypothetical protein F5Y04DRAFT_240839 [Hypomontagnella monticulosa]|nr:hypothetical protein F5Y04DRAFT_240839 [Hypomontagnella monticulosa]